jgi:CII-binding regulator of phage lambda lysogenization HflD
MINLKVKQIQKEIEEYEKHYGNTGNIRVSKKYLTDLINEFRKIDADYHELSVKYLHLEDKYKKQEDMINNAISIISKTRTNVDREWLYNFNKCSKINE